MRQVATLPEDRAELFADYLLTLGIETRLDRDGSGTIVWVCDEDKLPRARSELEAFQRSPTDSRYGSARRQAATIRQKELLEDEEYEERNEQLHEEMDRASQPPPLLLTLLLAGVCIAVFWMKKTDDLGDPTYAGFVIDRVPVEKYTVVTDDRGRDRLVPEQYLADIRNGQAWRLFSPAFLHFGIDHLIANLISLLFVAGAIEARLGASRLFGLVLLLAVVSNLAQYFLGGGLTLVNGWPMVLQSVNFGGLSGVLFGLFAYVWMKSRYQPELGLSMPPLLVLAALLFFVMCWLGIGFKNVANVAHTAGLLAGLGLGAIPTRAEYEPPPEDDVP